MLQCVQSSRASPSVEPIVLKDVKDKMRIDYSEDDKELSDLIIESREWIEEEIGRVLINQTVTEKFRSLGDTLELRWPPVSSVTSVAYIDTNGDSQTLATTVYELGHHLGIGRIRLKYNQTWPTTRDQHDAVTVTYVAGYGAAGSSVPLAIRQAMILYMQFRYDGSLDDNLLLAAKRLLGPYSARR